MDRKQSMIKKINKLVVSDYPMIDSINLINLSLDNNFINYKFNVNVTLDNFKKYVSSSDLFLYLIIDKTDNSIDSYWLNKYETDNFNWKEIRESIKSICKLYYNERIQNFDVRLKIV